jgi:hypothetical protein
MQKGFMHSRILRLAKTLHAGQNREEQNGFLSGLGVLGGGGGVPVRKSIRSSVGNEAGQ